MSGTVRMRERDRERGLEVISKKCSDETIYRQSDSMGIKSTKLDERHHVQYMFE